MYIHQTDHQFKFGLSFYRVERLLNIGIGDLLSGYFNDLGIVLEFFCDVHDLL
ncbi:hypothetical protein FQZ97_1122270 [compost metagenome]